MESEPREMSRRQVVGAAAWATPVILFAAATPAFAASAGDAEVVLSVAQIRQEPVVFDDAGSAAPAMVFMFTMSLVDSTTPLASLAQASITFAVPGVWTDGTQNTQMIFLDATQPSWQSADAVSGSIASVTLSYSGPEIAAGGSSSAEFAIRLDPSTDLSNTPLTFALSATTPSPGAEPISAPDSPYRLIVA